MDETDLKRNQERKEQKVPFSFDEAERRGVYRAIHERRDIRSYRPDPVSDELLYRLLDAAHHAPSVGFMQPWNFLVIRDRTLRERLYDHFRDVNEAAAGHYDGDRKRTYRAFKLQGLLDAPLNLLITCDPTRGGEHVLGRATIRETDLYSTCLAVENFWLAARAEGIGVGWMSLHTNEAVREIFQLPDHVIPVAYLTVGYPADFPDEPMLQSAGWRTRLDLASVIFEDVWGTKWSRSRPSNENRDLLDDATPFLPAQDESDDFSAPPEAIERLDQLTKPKQSLGILETVILRLAGIQKRTHPQIKTKSLILIAGDHGITEEGVSAYHRDLTARMVYQFIAGGGAINVFARRNGIDLSIVDLGVDHDFNGAAGIVDAKIRRGTRNFTKEPAMTREETERAIETGKRLVEDLSRHDLIATGEIGIGNTTSAAALVSVLLGRPPETVVGTGSGIGAKTLETKRETIRRAIERHGDANGDPVAILAAYGGYEIAGLVGVMLGAFERRLPVVLDGFITGAAALIAARIAPRITQILFASHRSKEPGHAAVLEALSLEPLLDLGMGLGEGSGAALAIGLIDSSVALMSEMRTFREAGIDDPIDPNGRL